MGYSPFALLFTVVPLLLLWIRISIGNDDDVKISHQRINQYIQTKPKILTKFQLSQNQNKKRLQTKDYEFPFNYWIDVSRVDEIHSLSEYSIIDVEFEISFADEDTKPVSYTHLTLPTILLV